MSLIQEALKRQQMENEGIAPHKPSEDISTGVPEKASIPSLKPSTPPKRINVATTPAKATPPAEATINPIFARSQRPPQPPPQPQPPRPKAEPETAIKAKPTTESTTEKRIKKSKAKKGNGNKKGQKAAILGLAIVLLIGALGYAIIYALGQYGITMPWTSSPTETLANNREAQTITNSKTKLNEGNKVANSPTAAPKSETYSAVAQQTHALQSIETDVKQEIAAETAAEAFAETPAEPPKHEQEQKNANVESTSTAKNKIKQAPPAIRKGSAPTITKVQPPKPKPPVIWPRVKISGFIGHGQKGSVIMDGKMVGVGNKQNGVKVVKICPSGVWLEYQGEQRFAKAGSTLQ